MASITTHTHTCEDIIGITCVAFSSSEVSYEAQFISNTATAHAVTSCLSRSKGFTTSIHFCMPVLSVSFFIKGNRTLHMSDNLEQVKLLCAVQGCTSFPFRLDTAQRQASCESVYIKQKQWLQGAKDTLSHKPVMFLRDQRPIFCPLMTFHFWVEICWVFCSTLGPSPVKV